MSEKSDKEDRHELSRRVAPQPQGDSSASHVVYVVRAAPGGGRSTCVVFRDFVIHKSLRFCGLDTLHPQDCTRHETGGQTRPVSRGVTSAPHRDVASPRTPLHAPSSVVRDPVTTLNFTFPHARTRSRTRTPRASTASARRRRCAARDQTPKRHTLRSVLSSRTTRRERVGNASPSEKQKARSDCLLPA